MFYTALTKQALKLAYDAHKGQTDKSGLPYVFHPFYLACKMDDEYSICVALLHDVIEDSIYTFNDLYNLGFPNEIIDAVRVLTHKKDVSYIDYINEIKKNPLASKVKIEDLKHNSDLSRLNDVTSDDLKRLSKYEGALKNLKS